MKVYLALYRFTGLCAGGAMLLEQNGAARKSDRVQRDDKTVASRPRDVGTRRSTGFGIALKANIPCCANLRTLSHGL
jgi:hypothetical protein